MDKATPTPSPGVENVMSIAFELARIREKHGAQSDVYLSEVRALRAEVERLAAQAAPTLLDAFKSGNAILIDWPMEPVTPQESLKLMDMMDAEYAKTIGKPAPDREMAICMQRVQHMACDLWASQKEVIRAHFVELAAAQAPVVQAGEYPPLPQAVMFTAAQMRAYVDADRASSGAAQAAPFAKDSWQHAVDNQLVAFGRTSQEFTNPHEAIAWLAIMNMELGQSNVGAAQAVRMLTREELNDVALSEQVGWGPGEYVEAVQRKFAEVNGLRIPADGKIGGV